MKALNYLPLLVCGLVSAAPQGTLPTTTSVKAMAPLAAPTPGPCAQIGASLCIPLDSTFSVVAFSGGACGRNDDGSLLYTFDGWQFDHFGSLTGDIWINNNGNLSIGVPFSTFSPSGFPVTGFPMIAPFWGDVDTRNGLGGLVWTKEWSVANGDPVNRLVVTWDNVGYYNQHVDKLSTFQVIITDGNDPLLGTGNNICFCYDDMQWTTGDASQGIGGFGGFPATVGVNEGNGVDFFQVGTFDHEGTDYDGPGGNPDGVSFLDNQQFCFQVSGTSTNAPPVFVNTQACPLDVGIGDVLNFDVSAIGPETGQIVSMTVDTGGLPEFTYLTVPGNPAVTSCTFAPTMLGLVGLNTITFAATDDGSPPASTVYSLDIDVALGPNMGTTYCTSEINSTGAIAHLSMSGSDLAGDHELMLQVRDLPAGESVLFIASATSGMIVNPGSYSGVLCLGGSIARLKHQLQISTTCGRAAVIVDTFNLLTNPSRPILAGETWHFQAWFRDFNAGGPNFSDAASAMFL